MRYSWFYLPFVLIATSCHCPPASDTLAEVCALTLPPGHCEVTHAQLVASCEAATGHGFPALAPAYGACDCSPHPQPLRCEGGMVYSVVCCDAPLLEGPPL